MIKLISQFDNGKVRASLATPTCCCCCCCCCIATLLTSSVLTARTFGMAAKKQMTAGTLNSPSTTRAFWAKVVGLLVLPVFLVGLFFALYYAIDNDLISDDYSIWVLLGGPVLVYYAALIFFGAMYRVKKMTIGMIAALTTLAFAIEFVGGAYLLLQMNSPWEYVVGALCFSLFLCAAIITREDRKNKAQ